MLKVKKGAKLDDILKALIALDHAENYKTGGDMWLNWRPPGLLYVSRFDVPPSEQEVATVERYLKNIGFDVKVGRLKQRRKTPDSPLSYYWQMTITKQRNLL